MTDNSTNTSDIETLQDIVNTTRQLLADECFQEAASYSGEAVACMHSRWNNALRGNQPSSMLLADTLFAVDNHLRVLFTRNMFTDIFTTAIVALAQATVDESFSPLISNPTPQSVLVAQGRMLLLADAVSALTRYVESNPPEPQSHEADHLSNMLLITASLLYGAYTQVKEQAPDNPELPEIYSLLRQFQQMGAIATSIDIKGTPTQLTEIGPLLGDLLGRSIALNWLND